MESKYEPKLFTLSNEKNGLEARDKAWLGPSIKRLRNLAAGLPQFISAMQASLSGKEAQLGDRKCSPNELRQYANEWTKQFQREVQNILEQNEFQVRPAEKDSFLKLNAVELEEAMRGNGRAKHLQAKVFEIPRTVLFADRLSGRTLNIGINVESGSTFKNRCCGLTVCTLYILCFTGLIGASYILYERFCEEMH